MIKDKNMNEATHCNLPQAISFYALLSECVGIVRGVVFKTIFSFFEGGIFYV